MTIHEAFAPYRVIQGDTPRIIGQKGIAFRLLVDNLSQKMGASWAFIMWMSFKGMPYATPDNLEAVWHSWGIDTVEKLIEFARSFNEINVKEIIDDISPFVTIDLKNRQKITPSELTQLVNDQCDIETLNIHFTDRYYFLPTQDDLENLLHYSRLPQIQYIPEKRDCDDYAHMFKSWLSYMGYGNLTIAYIEIRMYYPTKTSAHAVNLVVTEDRKVHLLEPQRSFVWNPKIPEPGWPGLLEQKIYLVNF